MTRRRPFLDCVIPLVLAIGLVFSGSALAASLSAEQQQGAAVLARLQHGGLKTNRLTTSQYENGEYLMGRALGSTQLHQRMNTLMDEMMGPQTAEQMHIYLGQRYLGINTGISDRDGTLYGLTGVMMSGYRGSPLAGMMSSYLNGNATGGYVGPAMMGYGPTNAVSTGSSSGWPTPAIIAVAALATLLIGATLAVTVPKVRRRRNHQPAPAVH